MFLYRVRHEGRARWALQMEEGGELEVFEREAFEEVAEQLMNEDTLSMDRLQSIGSLEQQELLAPSTPTKIVCVGLNYLHHAEEMGKEIPEEPLIFMKPTTALLAPGGMIELPRQSQMVHHEGELAMVVGRRARDVSEADFSRVILGFSCANDVSARDIQRREKRYTRGKGFDTFCPFGPRIGLMDLDEIERAEVICRVNGEERQRSGVDDLIFKLPRVVSFISQVMTLLPGDIILTGTPSGVGQLEEGDEVEVEVTGVGVLCNGVSSRR